MPVVAIDVDPVFVPQAQRMCTDAGDFIEQAGGRPGLADDGRASRAEDAGLLDRDRLAGVAEILLVVEIDGGDDGDIGIDQVDRIEAPTQTDLEHGHVEGRLREPLECRQCREFEKGQRDIAAHCIDAPESVDDGLVTGLDTVDDHALIEAEQMRRRVAAHPVPRRSQHRDQEGNGRALAIGAADRDHDRPRAWSPQTLVDRLDPRQTELDQFRRHGDQP